MLLGLGSQSTSSNGSLSGPSHVDPINDDSGGGTDVLNSTVSSIVTTTTTSGTMSQAGILPSNTVGLGCSPTDISSSIQDGPTQPRNHKFPSTEFSGSQRAFNPSWFDTYLWLEYSIERNAAFCYACRFFSSGQHRSENSFVTSGFTNWKKAIGNTGRFEKHNASERHQHAMSTWSDFTTNVSHNRSIASTLSTARQEQVQLNRHYMITLLHILKFCSFQEIALRGHREVESTNRGNFLELLELVCEHDSVVNKRLHEGPRNAVYTSHSIQDELISILAKHVRAKVCEEVKEAGYYSIIVDESRDLAKQEQMSFVVRYFNISDRKVHEHFLAFLHAECLDAASLSEYIKELVTRFDFDVSKLVSQGYDGASVMSGRHTGVQARVRSFAPYAAYIHCHAHILNLVLVDSVKSVQPAFEFFALLQALYVFVATSKVHVIFVEKQKEVHPGKQPLELQKLSDTRWVCRYAAVNAVCRSFDSILLTVDEVAESHDAEKSIEARGLYHQIASFSFLISLITFDRILTCTKQLSDQLQSSTLDLSLASELVIATQSLLTEYRTNTYWNTIYDYAVDIAKLHNITVDPPAAGRRRKRKRPSRLEDSVLLDTVGARDPASTSEEYKCHFYFPILDKFLAELSNRFDEKNVIIMKGVSSCTPSSSIFLSLNELTAFADAYGIETGTLQVECSLLKLQISHTNQEVTSLADFGCYLLSHLPAYRTVCDLVRVSLTIAVTSTESERSFSTMKRIKTRLRATMSQDRLSDLSVLSIEKEIARAIKNDDVIDEFAATDKNRRIVLF